jgi:hypothetical protein
MPAFAGMTEKGVRFRFSDALKKKGRHDPVRAPDRRSIAGASFAHRQCGAGAAAAPHLPFTAGRRIPDIMMLLWVAIKH